MPAVTRDEVEDLLARFVREVREIAAPLALWAHGSLALGDFQPGRSDLDLIALVERPLSVEEREALVRMHQQLMREAPEAAEHLHCSYLARPEILDPEQKHFTWAHGMPMYRTVTPVTRRELLMAGRVLDGLRPAGLLPAVSDRELAAFIRRELREYWLPATSRPRRWRMDVWVDLGLLTTARAAVALREGRLITKAEALDELTRAGAPVELVEDIRDRRYGEPAAPPGKRDGPDAQRAAKEEKPGRRAQPAGRLWRWRRGRRARRYVRRAILQVLEEERRKDAVRGTP